LETEVGATVVVFEAEGATVVVLDEAEGDRVVTSIISARLNATMQPIMTIRILIFAMVSIRFGTKLLFTTQHGIKTQNWTF
jgi:hypothetical protein